MSSAKSQPFCPDLSVLTIKVHVVLYERDPNLVTTVLADGLAPNGDTPSASTILTEKLDIFFQNFSGCQWLRLTVMDRTMSFNIADKISQNLMAPQVLTHWSLVMPYGDRDLGQHWLR